jgi:hypothetical protein
MALTKVACVPEISSSDGFRWRNVALSEYEPQVTVFFDAIHKAFSNRQRCHVFHLHATGNT